MLQVGAGRVTRSANAARAAGHRRRTGSRTGWCPASRSSQAASTTAPSAAKASAPPVETRLTPSAASSPTEGPPGSSRTLTGTLDRRDHGRDVVGGDQPGREHDIGTGGLVGEQPGDRVGRSSWPCRWFSARAVSTSRGAVAADGRAAPRRRPARRRGAGRRSGRPGHRSSPRSRSRPRRRPEPRRRWRPPSRDRPRSRSRGRPRPARRRLRPSPRRGRAPPRG